MSLSYLAQPPSPQRFVALTFSSDGKLIAAATSSPDDMVILFSVEKQRALATVKLSSAIYDLSVIEGFSVV